VVKLGTIPLVRRLEYIVVYLEGVAKGLDKQIIQTELGRRKIEFEYDKNLALGRGNPRRPHIKKAEYLHRYCFRLSRDLGFIDASSTNPRLLEGGLCFLDSSGLVRLRVFSEAYSQAYPHLGVLINALSQVQGGCAVLPMMNKPEFRSYAEAINVGMSQVVFDTVRDIATSLGLLNWFVDGVGAERRQHVYLTCVLMKEKMDSYLVRVWDRFCWLYTVPNLVDATVFRSTLYKNYLELADNIPGSPVFYSYIREKVCADLRLRDEQFDYAVMEMVNRDDHLNIVWSEGTLSYGRDSASILKSLPPKNEWGDYVVYLKIMRRS